MIGFCRGVNPAQNQSILHQRAERRRSPLLGARIVDPEDGESWGSPLGAARIVDPEDGERWGSPLGAARIVDPGDGEKKHFLQALCESEEQEISKRRVFVMDGNGLRHICVRISDYTYL
jgi:hypothetical protein